MRRLSVSPGPPVVDYELREIEYSQRMQHLQNESKQLRLEEQQRPIVHELRMKQLESQIAQLDELNSQIDELLFSSSTNPSPRQSTPDNSEALASWSNTANSPEGRSS